MAACLFRSVAICCLVGSMIGSSSCTDDSYWAARRKGPVALLEESAIWPLVVKSHLPSCANGPEKLGVVVVKVVLGSDGAVLGTRIVEVPPEADARVVENSVRTWTFRPPAIAPGSTAEGKITLYVERTRASCRFVTSVDRVKARNSASTTRGN